MSSENSNGWRTRPAYTVGQASKLAGTSHATIRRWLQGYSAPGHWMEPVFGEQRPIISFLGLAELVVVSAFRKKDIRLDRIRRAHQYAKEFFQTDFPFAFHDFKTDGASVLFEYQQREPGQKLTILADKDGQVVLLAPVLETVEQFDFEAELVARWFPGGRDIPIVVDPRMGAGLPTVVDRGVRVEIIHKRWKAGQSIAFIASDFQLKPNTVEKILQHAEKYAA